MLGGTQIWLGIEIRKHTQVDQRKRGNSWSEVKGESLFSFFKVLESRYTGNGCSTMHRVTTAKKVPELMKSAVGRQSVPVLVMRQILS